MFLCAWRHGCFAFHIGGPVGSGASSAPGSVEGIAHNLALTARCEQPYTPAPGDLPDSRLRRLDHLEHLDFPVGRSSHA